MKFLFYLSRRTLFHRRSDQFIPFIRGLAVVGLMIGTAAMAITMGILHGFEKNLVTKVTDFESHLRIESFKETLSADPYYIRKLSAHPHIDVVAPYSDLEIIIRKGEETDGVILECMEEKDFRAMLYKSKTDIEGRVDFRSDSAVAGIYLGSGVAEYLNAHVGDTLDILKIDGVPSPFNPIEAYPTILTGIFDTGMKEFDATYGYTSLDFAQKTVLKQDKISGYQVQLDNPFLVENVGEWIERNSDYHFITISWKERNSMIFRWLETQKAPILITFGIIALVAVFNIVSTLVMIVLVKEKDIAVLKSIGMTPAAIRKKYILDGLLISLIGSLAGLGLAKFLEWGQMTFAWIKISSDIYFVDRVPIDISWEVSVIMIASTVLLAVLATLYPAAQASRVKPVKVLRYE